MIITKDSIDYIKNGIYKYFIINNVINYNYENFNSIIIFNINNKIEDQTNYYLILAFPFSNAVFHWIAECCVYFDLYHKLKLQYPLLKIVFLIKKNYHKIICEYFNINDNDIVYSINENNTCIFPLPISMLNDPTICDDYKLYSNILLNKLNNLNFEKKKDLLILPRQIKDNHHTRINNCSDILNNIQKKIILNTDDITDFSEQIKYIKESNTIIVSDGSAFLLNGIIARNSKIIVLGDIVISQSNDYLKIKYYYDIISSINNVIFIPYLHGNYDNNNFLYDDINRYL